MNKNCYFGRILSYTINNYYKLFVARITSDELAYVILNESNYLDYQGILLIFSNEVMLPIYLQWFFHWLKSYYYRDNPSVGVEGSLWKTTDPHIVYWCHYNDF